MYYLVNEWSLDDERLRKDLEQIGLPIQSLQLENILDSIFFNQKVDSPLHMTSLPLPPFWEVCANGDIVSDGMKRGKIACHKSEARFVTLLREGRLASRASRDEAFWRSQVNFGPPNPATDEKAYGVKGIASEKN